MIKNTFILGEIVFFQAYKENEKVKGRIKKIGTLKELKRVQLDINDNRIFYELETLDGSTVFTCTTESSIYKM